MRSCADNLNGINEYLRSVNSQQGMNAAQINVIIKELDQMIKKLYVLILNTNYSRNMLKPIDEARRSMEKGCIMFIGSIIRNDQETSEYDVT